MTSFMYARPVDVETATSSGARHDSSVVDRNGTDFLGGGTDLMQLLKENLRSPERIVDLTSLSGLSSLETTADGIEIGALVRMSDAASHPAVRKGFPVISEALLASASPQVRNLATLGGNLLQRTRCGYFRDAGSPCNKREPGSGCPAITGQNRNHAIFGTSDSCIATYAGDFANALLVVDADLVIAGPQSERTIAVSALHQIPGETPWVETQLAPGELIRAIRLRTTPAARRSHYHKVRDRASFQWAIASAAVALETDDRDLVRDLRIAVGGVATKPWRLTNVEMAMRGMQLTLKMCREASLLASDGAATQGDNNYKKLLIQRTVERALIETAGLH